MNTSIERIERKRFLPLLLSNPNYFGNLENSPFKPINKIVADISYEELKCIGFNPQLNLLEGVVWVKQSEGFDGGICTKGSLEYVSFYLSYDNGVTWLAQGTTSFPVFDVQGRHPLEYAVSLNINPERKFCSASNLPLVRGVLSWNIPPAGPTTPPVWGNVLDARIQVAGYLREAPLAELLTAADLSLPAGFSGLAAESAAVKLQSPAVLSAAELTKVYANAQVPAHRYLYSSVQKALTNPAKLASFAKNFAELGVDVAGIVAAAEKTAGNVDYEQLGCIGLDEGTGAGDALVGTVLVKLPTGYLGNPCTAGSTEYVAFWIDWGGGWQYQGTAAVKVHDIAAIPKEGLSYAVYRPVDLNAHRKPCEQGPVTAKMRATLSWDAPPPPSNPNFVPTWGNSLDTNILVNPGAATKTGDFTPTLFSICDVGVCDIDQTTGWANPGAGDSPFGATVSIYGYIPGAPAFTSPVVGLPKYQITVQEIDTASNTLLGVPQIVTDPFPITVYQAIGNGPAVATGLNQNAPGGYYTYQQMSPDSAGWRNYSPPGLLAMWNSGAKTGTWMISITAWDSTLTTMYVAGSTFCPLDGNMRQGVVIDLDQLPPVAGLAITGYMPGGVGPCQPAADCQTFTVGDIICGSYSVADEHLGGFSLQAEPTPSPTGGFAVDGVPGNGLSYPSSLLPLGGAKSGVWTYNTAGLPACGYTIQLFSNDRTIVDCDSGWENNSNFVGFCLVAASAN
jgi:hypothetical protein